MFRFSCAALYQNLCQKCLFLRECFPFALYEAFEQNMKPLFTNFAREYSQKPYDELDDDEKMKNLSILDFTIYENLGFKVQTRSRANRGIMTVKKCSWAPSKPHDIFLCLICQSIMKLTYSWTNLPGTVESEPTTGILQSVCKFDYNMEI